MLSRHRLARFLLPLSRKSIARAGDPARPRVPPEPLAVHRYLYSAKNADKVAASQRGLGLEYAELPTKGDAVFPPSHAMIHLADRVYPLLRRHFPAPTFLRIRDKARSKPP